MMCYTQGYLVFVLYPYSGILNKCDILETGAVTMFMEKGAKAPNCIGWGGSVTGQGVGSGWVTG
jgi:hypothetical protein